MIEVAFLLVLILFLCADIVETITHKNCKKVEEDFKQIAENWDFVEKESEKLGIIPTIDKIKPYYSAKKMASFIKSKQAVADEIDNVTELLYQLTELYQKLYFNAKRN